MSKREREKYEKRVREGNGKGRAHTIIIQNNKIQYYNTY
jgi:hypothetical protein